MRSSVLRSLTIALSLLLLTGCGDDDGQSKVNTFLDTASVEDTRDAGQDAALDTSTPPDVLDTSSGGDTSVSDVLPDTSPPDVSDTSDVAPMGYPVRSCSAELVYRADASTQVSVGGVFNGWDPDMTPLAFSDGAWRTEVTLSPGHYAYKFVVGGVWEGDAALPLPADVYTHWESGVENRDLHVTDCDKPEWETVSLTVSPTGFIHGEFQFVRATSEAAIDPASVALAVGLAGVTPTIDAMTGRVSFDYQAPAHGKYSVRLRADDTDGVQTETNPFYIPFWYEEEAFDWRDTTLYLIFTDRFLDTDGVDRRIPDAEEMANYQGGDFQGITQKINEGYFDDLGINAIWLSPVYDNTDTSYPSRGVDFNDPTSERFTGFHGYWPVSYDPEPRYGNGDHAAARAALKALTAAAHEHGIRIVFDIALNHVHEDHHYCTENPSWCVSACLCGTGAGCGWDPGDGGIDCLFDWFLPDLSYRNHDIVERVVADTLALLEEYDVDGLRIDAARHMDHVIMRTLRMTLRDKFEAQGSARYYTVGETFTYSRPEIMDFVADHELHAQFDFPMMQTMRYVFGPQDGSFEDLDAAAAASEGPAPNGYGPFVDYMSPFFGNHDVDRFATVIAQNKGDRWGNTPDLMADGPTDTVTQWDMINRMSMAFAFLLTYRGVPLIYYGDEIGLAGADDPDNRRPMIWERNANQNELFSRVQTIGRARQDLPALRRGGRRELWKDGSLYVYIRDIAPGEAVIVAMAKGARAETVTVPTGFGLEGMTLQSYNSSRSVTVTGESISIDLNPWEYAIFHTP